MSASLHTDDWTIEQGDDIELVLGPLMIRDPVTRALTPIDTTAGGIKLWLTAKRALTDADAAAVIRLGSPNVGGGLTGIVVNTPPTTAKNYVTITIPGALTEAIAAADLPLRLRYDVQLEEPTGKTTTLRRGTIMVVADATDA
jgi:hypothetical protein